MADTLFRTAAPPAEESPLPAPNLSPGGSVINIDVPHMDYEMTQGHPHTVDYFNLGSYWQDREAGYTKEVQVIEDYVQGKIKAGELANNTDDVELMLKKMEKLHNVDKESRAVVRIATLAHYIEFLNKQEGLKTRLRYVNQ